MRVTLPLLRIQPARAPILRYGVAVLSTTLALIPALLLPNITESRLAVFAVAVMVSAWYGGWKPGLVATSFALTVSAYFSFTGERTPAQFRSTMLRLALFVMLAALICWLNAALRAAQEGLRRSEMNFRSLVTNAPYGICRCDSSGKLLDANPALLAMLGYSSVKELASRASSLTRQLLAFSRKQMLAPKILDLNGVVTENLKMLTRMIGEDIDLVMVPATGLGAVRADAGQIEQVIMNLAVNERDAMPSGGKLTIKTSNESLDEAYARFHAPLQPGNYVMLAISDTGAGMDAETQSHIFEPFFTTKGPKGTGLGLSTVYGIVKQSGGYVWVYSEQGRGTTFKIYLPRVAETVERPAPAAVLPDPVAKPGTETILLVEDENNLRYLAGQFLEKQGYRVIEAADGAVAMQIAVAHEGMIHLLLTDVIMPGMNGRELAQRISEIRPNVKVLYMSGYTENVIGRNGTLDAGVRLLQKPFTLRDLKSKVREVLDSTPFPPEAAMPLQTDHAATQDQDQLPFPRAQRFQLQLPLKYRRVEEDKWHDGETRNISRSGLLFQAEDRLQPNVILEINLVLPAEIAGLSATEVVCRGEVVRTVESAGEEMPPALAAKILQYRFQHGSELPRA